jgi:pimeloyl-ACP methyl ester carboxylesterase
VSASPTWLIVPGLGLGASSWAPTIDALGSLGLEPAATTVATLPGYGVRAGRHEDLSPAALARSLLEQWITGDRHVLLGHSASCQVVVQAAALARGRVVGLVLVGPTTDPRANSWWALAGRWLSTARHEPAWQVPTLIRQYRSTGLATMVRAMDAARRHRTDLALPAVDCPVLVVRGAHDRIAPRDWAEGLAATAPDGRHVTLPDGGHMVPLTQPALVASACMEHIEKQSP